MPAQACIEYAETAVMILNGAAYWIIRPRG